MSFIKKRAQGFTLVEMSVVLVIVGLLVSSGFSMVGAYVDNAKQSHTKGGLEATKAALLSYVKVNKYMPCPDTNGDGRITDPTDKSGNQCNTKFGTVPFDDLGLAQGHASDNWGNVFGYGVHSQAISAGTMGLDISDDAQAETLKNSAGSYFYSTSAPAFDLDTPPTYTDADFVAESYTICKRTAADDCSGATDKELEYIPAVIVAFNINGGITKIDGCGTASRGARETENCDGDMQLIKGVFSEGAFDDQLVTISAYEIKQQVLDVLNNIELNSSSGGLVDWTSYDYIVNQNFTSSNELNVSTSLRNTYLITGDMDTNGTINLKSGNDVLAIMGTINYSNVIKGKAGHDVLLVSNSADSYAVSDYADEKAALSDAVSKVSEFEIACYLESLTTCYSVADDTLVSDMNYGNDTGDLVVFP